MDNNRDIESQEDRGGQDDNPEMRRSGESLTECEITTACLSWKDLKLTVDGKRFILQGLSGCAEPGRLLAIMGPSGSGKSTLLDTLAGRPSRDAIVTGDILVNGHKANLSYGSAAYLSQDVLLLGTLTVYETLYYSAKLRFKDSTSESETKRIVMCALEDVGLVDCAHTPIGNWYRRGISGGEKRRVSIAIELLTSPTLIFLDEPTSGLDSASSFHVIKTLKTLARGGGRTILCSIHQPSSEVFELFDDLCLLSDGLQVYYGPLPRALQFFERNGYPCPRLRSPSDHYLHCANSDFDIVERELVKQASSASRSGRHSGRHLSTVADMPRYSGRHSGRHLSSVADMPRHSGRHSGRHLSSVADVPQTSTKEAVAKLTQAYKLSDEKKMVDNRARSFSQMDGVYFADKGSNASFLKQAVYLTMRSFRNMNRDFGYFWLRLVMYMGLSTCIGTIFNDIGHGYNSIQARASAFIFVVCFMSFMAIAGFPSFIEDMKVYQTERLNGHYRVGAFVVGNTLSSMPFLLIISLVSTGIIYPLVKFHGGFVTVLYFILALYACLLVSEAMMMAVCGCVTQFLLGIMLGAGLQGVYILVSGFFRLPDDLPDPVWKYPLFYVSYIVYGFQGFMTNEMKGNTFDGPRPGNPPITGHYVTNVMYQLDGRSKWWNLTILLAMFIGYRIIFFTLLTGRENVFPTIGSLIFRKWLKLKANTRKPSWLLSRTKTQPASSAPQSPQIVLH